MLISCLPISQPIEGDGIKERDQAVKVSGMPLHHNHLVTTKMLSKTKKITHQYPIRPEVLYKIMHMLDIGLIPTKTKQFLPTVKTTGNMVWNVRMHWI